MTEDLKRREEFLDRCLVEADSIAEALEMARKLEAFVLGEDVQDEPPPRPEKKQPRKKATSASVPAKLTSNDAGQSGKPGVRTLLNEEQASSFVDMCIAGASIEELADEFSLQTTQVYTLKKKHKSDIMAGAPKTSPGRVADQSEGATRERARSADQAFGAAGASFGEDDS